MRLLPLPSPSPPCTAPGRPRLRRALLASLLALSQVLAPAPAWAQGLPGLGDAVDMGVGAERRLGDSIARELYRDPDYLEDAVLDDYVDAIWQKLLAAARTRGELTPELEERFAWELMIGRDRSVNAFALPGDGHAEATGLLARHGARGRRAARRYPRRATPSSVVAIDVASGALTRRPGCGSGRTAAHAWRPDPATLSVPPPIGGQQRKL